MADNNDTRTDPAHEHEWSRHQNVTSKGYAMRPYEACACGAARPEEPDAAPSRPPVAPEEHAETVRELERVRGQLADAVEMVKLCSGHPDAGQPSHADMIAAAARPPADNDQVTEFCAERAQYITSIENCHPDNARDYYRWQGHAEARRQLAQRLGLPVAWPAKTEGA